MAPKLYTLLFAWFLVLPLTCFAEQIKIVDGMGLTRAVKKTSGTAAVVVKTRTGGPNTTMFLNNVDGILPDVPGTGDGKGSFHFEGVREGTWKITAADKVDISQVSIEK